MKCCYSLMASAVAASTIAFSSYGICGLICKPKDKSMNSRTASLEKAKFAPNFDGLRFIETLVTAHSDNSNDGHNNTVDEAVAYFSND